MLMPAHWEVTEEDETYVQVFATRNGIFFIWSGNVAGEEMEFDSMVEDVKKTALAGATILSTGEETVVYLADGVQASQATIEARTTVNGTAVPINFVFTYVRRGGQDYVGMMFAHPDALSNLARTIDQMYASIHLFRPVRYGLEYDETLYMLGSSPNPDSLDPALTGSAASGYVGYLFSGLVRLTSQLQIVPDLAESWTVSPDGMVYTFTLRPGIKFSSGEPITAEDFKKSWQRAADPETGSNTVRTYLGDIVGVQEMLDGAASEISGVKVIDAQTLEVTLDGPKAYFLAKLTYPTAYVYEVSQAKRAPTTWMFNPDASGPYKVRKFVENEIFVFERNDFYYAPPAIPYVAFQSLSSVSRLSLYQDGIVDIVYLGGEDAQQVRQQDDSLHDQWQSVPSLCTYYVQLNNTLPPFDDPQVRQAFVQAIDREVILERIFNNADLPALSILPPAMPGFSADLAVAPFDPDAARAALAASTYAGDLPEVIMTVAGTADSESDYLNALIEMWKTNLGVKIKVEYVDPSNQPESIRTQHGHLVSYGWCADYPDPENFLDVLFHTGAEFNVVEYTNPELDAVLEQARVELDPAVRLQLYRQVETMLLEDYAAIPVVHSVNDVLVHPRVEGFLLSPMNSAFIQEIQLIPGR